jgi:hypothetical protein
MHTCAIFFEFLMCSPDVLSNFHGFSRMLIWLPSVTKRWYWRYITEPFVRFLDQCTYEQHLSASASESVEEEGRASHIWKYFAIFGRPSSYALFPISTISYNELFVDSMKTSSWRFWSFVHAGTALRFGEAHRGGRIFLSLLRRASFFKACNSKFAKSSKPRASLWISESRQPACVGALDFEDEELHAGFGSLADMASWADVLHELTFYV